MRISLRFFLIPHHRTRFRHKVFWVLGFSYDGCKMLGYVLLERPHIAKQACLCVHTHRVEQAAVTVGVTVAIYSHNVRTAHPNGLKFITIITCVTSNAQADFI